MLVYGLGSIVEHSLPLFFSSMDTLHHTGLGLLGMPSGCLPDYKADPGAQASGG